MLDKLKKVLQDFLHSIINIFSTSAHKKVDRELGGGLIGVGEKETDYIFGASIHSRYEGLEPLRRQPEYEYDQGAQYETRNWCTIYSAITELSYLMDYKFTLCQIQEIGHKMIADGKLDPDRGAYLSDAIDYTRKWWNEKFPSNKVESYRLDLTDKSIRELLMKTIRLYQIGYHTSKELNDELQTFGYAAYDNYENHGGHAVSQYGLWTIDNYRDSNERNRYVFRKFDELIENGVIYKSGYVFLKAK